MPLITTVSSGSARGYGAGAASGGAAFARLFTGINEQSFLVPAAGVARVWMGGAGGSNASGTGGIGGIFSFDILLAAGETVYAGVGGQAASNSGYAMPGASGQAGSGGGGSYLRLGTPAGRPNWNGYAGIAGGGGGGANHSFTANYGGSGFGVGGGGYDSSWPNYSYGGKNGFDGNGGYGGSPQSGGQYGGSSQNGGNQLGGGQGGGGSQTGGGGGGGAGGGSGGAGSSGGGGAGGYVSTNYTANGFSTSVIPMGGGGGGSHGNSCGGSGGGGGVLLFSGYTNSWGAYPNVSGAMSNDLNGYTAWTNLSSYSTTWLGGDLTTGTLAAKCRANQNGFVLIASLNKAPALGVVNS